MATENKVLGPKAPKDPTKKTQGFFIMRNKEVCGSPLPDGKGVQMIYQNDGRMVVAAGLVGNITDEKMLKMLTTTEEFRKLVHSIGVSVETENPDEDVVFFFQMYGKTDAYNSGTTLELKVKGDGMENILELEGCEWSDDDDIPGQMRFLFEKAGTLGTVSVKFYLNDGYTAPPVEEEGEIDFESEVYKKMIEKSLLFKGNNARIKRVIDKARRGEDVTLAFIGGSITQGAGAIPINAKCYARKIFEGFCDLTGRGYEDNVHYIKAGVGGTPSELGIVRYDHDVLKDKSVEPDFVLVEFSVNDAGDETEGRFYDSLVRRIYNSNNNPAVLLLSAVFTDGYNLQERHLPVGKAYGIPLVSTKESVYEQFSLKASEGRVVSKGQYFYDRYHPTNVGHKIMADGVINLFKVFDGEKADAEIASVKDIKPPYGGEFENIVTFDRASKESFLNLDEGGFTDTDALLQCVERDMDLAGTPEFPNNWMHVPGESKAFSFDIECKSLVLIYKDSADIDVGTADIYVDDKLSRDVNPRDVGWTHANAYIIYESTETRLHHVRIEMKPGFENMKFTILGFGVVK